MSEPRRWHGYEVAMKSTGLLSVEGDTGPILSLGLGRGRLTLVADARPLRNRYIGDHDHAEWLVELIRDSPFPGVVRFVRSGALSFWGLVWARASPLVIGVLVLTCFWLWKNLPRFGPIDATERGPGLRDYGQHLEALGDFHWRLDRGQSLLQPLRAALLERARRLADESGRTGADIFGVMGEQADLTRERVERAMTHEKARDATDFSRRVADLQTLHLRLP
jgi:hypothetical protein